jgi:precorrin-6B methylase 1
MSTAFRTGQGERTETCALAVQSGRKPVQQEPTPVKPCVSAVGRLVLAGSGIKAIAHLTPETMGHIRRADIVFYHATSGVVATQLHQLNSNALDLYQYYGEGKVRNSTYIQMAELMLREVRRGKYVVGVFHGHPGFFVKSGRRALAIAKMEGHETQLLPGISATDCLFADLRIDPGVIGVQILKASQVLRKNSHLSTDNHVLLIQVNSVGDNTFSFAGYKHAKLDKLFGELISVYGSHHDSVYYVAPIFPGFDPIITVRKLADYRDREVLETVSASILYLPPVGMSFESLTGQQAFDNDEPYNGFAMRSIAELDNYVVPHGYKKRGASAAMVRIMEDLTTTPDAVSRYLECPEQFVAGYVGLDDQERRALANRALGEMRQATTDRCETRCYPISPPSLQRARTTGLVSQRGTEVGRRVTEASAKYAMNWTPEMQSISVDGQNFVHDGPIKTDPSHDLAHLMIAANGNLLWAPEGRSDAIKLAEYNAVFLEHLLNNTYNGVLAKSNDGTALFLQTLAHARWFVEEHFAPFPIPSEEAYCQFCWHIDDEMIVRLSPYFFNQKRAERDDTNYKLKSWAVQISPDDRLVPLEQSEIEFQLAVSRQMMRLKNHGASSFAR